MQREHVGTRRAVGIALMLAVMSATPCAWAHGAKHDAKPDPKHGAKRDAKPDPKPDPKHDAKASKALLRCQEQITSEGLGYTSRLNQKLARCLLPLNDCAVENAGHPAACARAVQRCRALPNDMRSLADRMVSRIASVCSGVGMNKILGDLGFAEQMADCAPTTPRQFAVCLVANLQQAESIAMLRLAPASCDLLDDAGLLNAVPASLCQVGGGGGSEEPGSPTCENQYCGGPQDLACPDGMVCDKHDDMCGTDAAGVCVPMPTECQDDAPVCGCDGQTYASDCDRLQAGVTHAYDGACAVATPCSSSSQCGAGSYCEFSTGDCGESQSGVCRPMEDPSCEMCSAYAMGQVCGCDGMTYPSECARIAAGVSKLADGSCWMF
jgi:hypothetical protein